jgi:glutamate 5-kinase
MTDVATEADRTLLRHALELAENGRGRVSPNPVVGAVIARDGEVIGKGISNYSAAELRAVKGLKSDQVRARLPRATEEAVHRDYFVLA